MIVWFSWYGAFLHVTKTVVFGIKYLLLKSPCGAWFVSVLYVPPLGFYHQTRSVQWFPTDLWGQQRTTRALPRCRSHSFDVPQRDACCPHIPSGGTGKEIESQEIPGLLHSYPVFGLVLSKEEINRKKTERWGCSLKEAKTTTNFPFSYFEYGFF